MTDAYIAKGLGSEGVPSQLSRSVASDALHNVASKPLFRITTAQHNSKIDPAVVQQLCRASHDADERQMNAYVSELLKQGVPRMALIEDYIPATARDLGDQWLADHLSFVQVSIGAARLQAALRGLYAALPRQVLDVGLQLAVITPPDEQHTIGTIIVGNTLRLAGHTVWLATGFHDYEIVERLARRDFDAILVSIAQERNLAKLPLFLERVRAACHQPVSLYVGGCALERLSTAERSTLGADLVTSDMEQVTRHLAATTEMKKQKT
ncbi:hypothetical protein [Phaeobacter sp.]|uniref:cobalamin B12-binding domain-containing protein n=1 Tax=Phaeobacter sp. TaxID=1902409 RepID=UPI0025ED3E8B|nr:hypothetical protein [Phaeobacter sp.]